MAIYSEFSHEKLWFFHSYVSLPEGISDVDIGAMGISVHSFQKNNGDIVDQHVVFLAEIGGKWW